MKHRTCALGLISSLLLCTPALPQPSAASAASAASTPPAAESCPPAVFEPFDAKAQQAKQPEQASQAAPWLAVSAAPLAELELPAPLTRLGLSPSGSLVFRGEDERISGGLVYETPATVALHESGATPGVFFAAVFRGEHPQSCLGALALRLHEQDYRLHIPQAHGEAFAFGQGDRHHVFIISQAHPDLVLNASFNGIDQTLMRQMLARLKIR